MSHPKSKDPTSLRKSDYRKKLKQFLGYKPRKMHLYRMALRHMSAAENHDANSDLKNSNERLEYLGDAVLDLVVAEIVFNKFPFKGEGYLTEVRSKIVSRKQLGFLAEKMGIIEMIETDSNVPKSRHIQLTLGGNALEAIIGAIYLDRGYNFCKKYIFKKIIKPYIDLDEIEKVDRNYKSMINQWAQKEKRNLEFEVVPGQGNKKKFTISLMVDGKEIARGTHFSKKSAEKIAAAKACRELELVEEE